MAWFGRDPEIYANPEEFRPERFLGPNPEPNPYGRFIFGFGRRICPGRLIAEGNFVNIMAKSLSVFNVSKAIDEVTGQVIEPVVLQSPGTGSSPMPFKCRITPRSEKHAEMIRIFESKTPWGDGNAEAFEEVLKTV